MSNTSKALSEQLLDRETDVPMQIFNQMEAFLGLLQKAEPVGYLTTSIQELAIGWGWPSEKVDAFLRFLVNQQWIHCLVKNEELVVVFRNRDQHYSKSR